MTDLILGVSSNYPNPLCTVTHGSVFYSNTASGTNFQVSSQTSLHCPLVMC